MEEIFELENANEEFVGGCLDEYNFLLKVHDDRLRDIICTPDGREQREGSPYNPTKLSTLPFDPDVALLLFVSEKSARLAKARAETAKKEAAEDPELAKIRQQKLEKLKGK